MKKLFILFVLISSIVLVGCETKDPKDLILEAITNYYVDNSDVSDIEIVMHHKLTEETFLMFQYLAFESHLEEHNSTMNEYRKTMQLNSLLDHPSFYEDSKRDIDNLVSKGDMILDSLDLIREKMGQEPDTLKPIYYFVVSNVIKRSVGLVETPFLLNMDYEIIDFNW